MLRILEAAISSSLGEWKWFRQCCEKAIAASTITKDRDPDQVWRITGSSDLQRAIGGGSCARLWQWRESEAQAVDRPTFHILHGEQLIDAAARMDRGDELWIDPSFDQRPAEAVFRGGGESMMELPEE